MNDHIRENCIRYIKYRNLVAPTDEDWLYFDRKERVYYAVSHKWNITQRLIIKMSGITLDTSNAHQLHNTYERFFGSNFE